MERLARERREKEESANNAPVVRKEPVVQLKTNQEFDPTEVREAFHGFRKSKKPEGYDPLQLLKSKVSGEPAIQGREVIDESNIGVVSEGTVTFNNDDEDVPTEVNKIYYSSSDESDEEDDTKSKTTQENNKSQTKTYESSSSEDEEDKNIDSSVLNNLKSFDSFWKDSDEEEEPMEEDKDETKSAVVSKKKEVKIEKRFKFEDASIFRYDPNDDDQEKYVESKVSDGTDNKTESKPKSFYEVREDLKSVFGQKSDLPVFSFGFRRDKEDKIKVPESISKLEKVSVESDSDEEFSENISKQDIANNFGLQLKGKSSSSKHPNFFFTENDPRLESGIAYFFDKKVNLDDLRENHNKQRPILSEILKKRTRNLKAKNKNVSRSGSMKRKGGWKMNNKRKKFKSS